MLAKYEARSFDSNTGIWLGRYARLKNFAHWHDEYELIHVLEGSAEIGVNGVTYSALPGDAFFCKGGDVHYIRGSDSSIMSVCIFKDSAAEPVVREYALRSPKLGGCYAIERLHEGLALELNERKPFYRQRMGAMLTELVIDIYRGEPIYGLTGEKSGDMRKRYRELLNDIDRRYAEMTFTEAAKRMGFTPSHFSKVFSGLTGTTFTKYLNAVRVEKAVDMLKKTDATVVAVAMDCGFNSVRNFNRIFKRLTEYTPTELPRDYIFNMKPVKSGGETFDPTMPDSFLIR